MILNSIYLVASDLGDSVDFYTRILGMKEIERTPNTVASQEREFIKSKRQKQSNTIALQGRDIGGCLVLGAEKATKERWDEDFAYISFTVDDLDNVVQKLEDEDVEVKLKNNDDGTQTASFLDPNDVVVMLTTAPPPDMADGEETEIRLDGIYIKTDDVENSVDFYTQVLGLTEIEGWTYEDDEDFVRLQAGDIVIELSSTGWFESEGVDHIDFIVNNLNNVIQKLKAEDVDVDFYKDDETGEPWISVEDPDDVEIILSPLAQNAETPTSRSAENAEGEQPYKSESDAAAESIQIAEKVRFWEEQDKINQELIPRVIRQNELLSQHIAEHDNLQQILSDTIQKALTEQARQYEAALETAQKQLKETHDQITQKALADQARQCEAALETLRQEARRTRNRLTVITVVSVAIAALMFAVLT